VTSVRDVMHAGLVSCSPKTRIGAMARMLVDSRVHAVVVVGGDGEALGVVADSDLLVGEWLAEDEDSLATMRAMTAGELMTAPVVTISADASVERAAALLLERRLSRLVVTESDRPIGVVAISDLVAYLARAPLERGSVADVMSHGIVVCRDNTPVVAAARAMGDRRCRAMVVLGNEGQAVGVLSGRDLLPQLIDGAGEQTVDSLMRPPHVITPDATLREAADTMIAEETHRLLVMASNEKTPSGVISAAGIAAEMAGPGSPWRDRA
jgi:CBS domain-containing protein